MKLSKKKKNVQEEIGEELFKYPEKGLLSIEQNFREGSLMFTFANSDQDLDKLLIKFLGVSAYYYQNDYGNDKFKFDKHMDLFLLESIDIMDPPLIIGEKRPDFSSKGNVVLEVDLTNFVIECQEIWINEKQFKLG